MLRKDQIKGVLEKTGSLAGKLILVPTDGDVREASLLAGQQVYKAAPSMLRRLGVERVPSLVEQVGGKLRVKEIALR